MVIYRCKLKINHDKIGISRNLWPKMALSLIRSIEVSIPGKALHCLNKCMSKYAIELELAVKPTDSNQLLGRDWRAKHSLYKKIKDEIFLLTRNKTPEKPLENFQLSFTRYSTKFLDYDNFITSLKSYIDGLKLAGIIIDDRWEFIKQINTNQVLSSERKLVIRVDEVDANALCKEQNYQGAL